MTIRKTFAIVLLIASMSAFAQEKSAAPSATLTALVTTVSGSAITVLNGTVMIDTAGAVFTSRRGNATIADVKPGQQITAVIRNPDATPGTVLRATSVSIMDVAAGTFTGPIQSIDATGSSLTILGVRIVVNANTKILTNKRDAAAKLSDLSAGDVATVEVAVAGSTLVAETIFGTTKAPAPPQQPDQASISGTVKSIGATAWVITGRDGRDTTVIVNATTKIDTTIKVGDSVNAIGAKDSAGNFVASAIFKNTESTKKRGSAV